MTAEEAGKKFDVHTRTVLEWARRGLFPGATRIRTASNQTRWEIPEDAKRPDLHVGGRRMKGVSTRLLPPRSPDSLTWEEKVAYIRAYAHLKTYAQLRAFTGLTTIQIRAVYDRLHRRYGI